MLHIVKTFQYLLQVTDLRTDMQHVLRYKIPKRSQKSLDLVQRVLNVLDSVQHLLYFPSAAHGLVAASIVRPLWPFGTERSGRKPRTVKADRRWG
jgi:hypothetical protein